MRLLLAYGDAGDALSSEEEDPLLAGGGRGADPAGFLPAVSV